MHISTNATRRYGFNAAATMAISVVAWMAMAQATTPQQQLTAMQQRLQTLAQEAALLRDEKEIEKLQRAYGYYVDKKLWDEVADLFADNATMELGLNGVFVGKSRIRHGFEMFGPQGLKDGELFNHMQLQPIVHVAADGNSAKARWRAFTQVGAFGKRALWGEGVYENEYVKENGVWKIQKLHFYDSFATPYEKGWAKEVLPPPQEYRKGFEPDRPPTAKYEGFPKYFVPPFHYANPVTGHDRRSAAAAQPPATISAMQADVAQSIAQVQRTIQTVTDQNQIENLISAYGYYLDKAQWDHLADLFADNGTLELAQRGIYVGKSRVRASLDILGPQGPRRGHLGNHIQVQPIIDVAADGNSALIRSRALLQTGDYGDQGYWGEGIYENEAVKEGGVWKFRKVHFFNTFRSEYDQGWAKNALEVPGINDEFPPDQPPSIVYKSYPSAFTAPFHYKNPVSGK